MYDKVVSEEPFMLKYCFKTQDMCDKTVDASLPELKFVPDWFVTNKMLEKLDYVVFSNNIDDIDFVTFFSEIMTLVTLDLNNSDLDDDKFDEDDPYNIILVRITAWHNRFKQRKACKER